MKRGGRVEGRPTGEEVISLRPTVVREVRPSNVTRP